MAKNPEIATRLAIGFTHDDMFICSVYAIIGPLELKKKRVPLYYLIEWPIFVFFLRDNLWLRYTLY